MEAAEAEECVPNAVFRGLRPPVASARSGQRPGLPPSGTTVSPRASSSGPTSGSRP